MLNIFKRALIDRSFYKTDYKKVSRKQTFLYLLFVSFLASLLVAPLITSNTLKTITVLKKQILKVPPKIEIEISKQGLNTSVKEPIVFKTPEAVIVIDPNSKYKPIQNSTVIVFRKKGIVVYQNKQISVQEEYPFTIGAIKITFGEIQKTLRTLSLKTLAFKIFLLTLLIFFIIFTTNLAVLSLLVGIPYYLVLKGLFKINLTLAQSIKKFVFLGTYYILGNVFSITINLLGIGSTINWSLLFFVFAYFFLALLPTNNKLSGKAEEENKEDE